MDINTFGIASVAAVTALCYLAGQGAKLLPAVNNRAIPVICGAVGVLLGLVWFFMGWPDFPAADPITAAAVGAVSGLAATGADQIYKQLSNYYTTE